MNSYGVYKKVPVNITELLVLREKTNMKKIVMTIILLYHNVQR